MKSEIKISSNTVLNAGIKIAFATNDNENIDAHFGSCQKFVIYDVSNDGYSVDKIVYTKDEKN